VRRAKKLLAAPKGSLSLGRTNGGSIVNAVDVPIRGRSYAFFSVISSRKSNFGTDEMARLIPRLARKVARQYPGSVLGVGNISVEEGGPIGQSVSHRSGRDVDLGIYALNRSGRRVNLRAFRKFEEDGWDRQHKYQFDTKRNLALVLAMLTDEHTEVQWIFIAEWLKRRLIAEAWEQAVSPHIIQVMETVLHQPGDSNPHHDHYHVRLYCSTDDRRHGCIERGPIWDWVDLGDANFQHYVSDLIEASHVRSNTWRGRIVRHLGRIRAIAAIPRLLELLDDPAGKVRKSALTALRSIGEPESCPQLIAKLATVADARIATGLVRIALALDHPQADGLSRDILHTPERVLLTGQLRTAGMVRSALYRLGIHGEAQDAAFILPFLKATTSRERRAAGTAMQRLTGTRYQGAETLDATQTFWMRFLSLYPANSRATWFVHSLRDEGIRISEPASWSDVPALISVLRHKRALVAHTASRLLTHITGHPIDPRARTPRNTQRAWRTFWKHLNEFTAPAAWQRVMRRAEETIN